MADLLGVEIARPGEWHLKSGDLTVTEAMLHDAAAYGALPDARPSPLTLGHADERFDGEPALGWLANLRVEDDKGPVLKGDLTGMPDWLAGALPTAWPDRSMEGWTDFVTPDRTYAMVVDGLALLGVTPPGMSTIRSLRDLPQALGVAASSRMVASLQVPQVSAAPAAVAPPAREGAGMDPAKIREGFGLPADASDEDVTAAVVAAGLAPAVTPDPVPSEVTATATGTGDAPGTIRVAQSTWDAMQENMSRVMAKEAKRERDERDQVIAAAISAGKFTPVQRDHFSRLWDADPQGTHALIDSLAKNSMPVMAMGSSETADEIDAEFAHLFPPVQKGA